jgi:HSP20 family protein
MAKQEEQPVAVAPASPLEWLGLRWPDWMAPFTEATMRLEEFNEEGTHVVRVEMPGIDPDKDVDLTVENGMLSIRAERREEHRTEDKHRYRSEFTYGAFSRTVRLPVGATEQDVKASYADGILEIRFPIDDQKAEARKIPIDRG